MDPLGGQRVIGGMNARLIILIAPLTALAAACGNAPPPQPDPEKLERLIATVEATERAIANEDGKPVEKALKVREKASKAERFVETLDKSLPKEVNPTAAEAILDNLG